jgi:hypothetical protein
MMPAAPDDAARGDHRSVAERDVSRTDLGDRDTEMDLDALARQHLRHVAVRRVRERPEQRVAQVDDVDSGPGDVEVLILDGHRLVDEVGQGAGRLDAGRPATDDHEVQGAAVDQAWILVRRLEDTDHSGAQALRVRERVQRKRMVRRPGRVEEVGDRSRRQDHRVAPVVGAVRRGDGVRHGVDRHDLRHLHVDVRMAAEELSQREGDVADASCDVATW